jgi:uncharacterized protein DUF3592
VPQFQQRDIVGIGMRRLRNVRRVVRWIRGAVAQLRERTDYSVWPTTEAEVYLNDSTFASPFNYPAAEIWYTYRAIGQRWSGLCRVYFHDRFSAGFYAGLHPPGSKVAVRYNPAVPKDSVMLEKDQLNPYPVAVAMQEHLFL